jgi:hypothetical protein
VIVKKRLAAAGLVSSHFDIAAPLIVFEDIIYKSTWAYLCIQQLGLGLDEQTLRLVGHEPIITPGFFRRFHKSPFHPYILFDFGLSFDFP